MIKNLEFYVKRYKMLDNDFCNETIKQLQNADWFEHSFYNNTIEGGLEHKRSGNQELEVSHHIVPNKKVIMEKLWHHIKAYITEDLNLSWFDGWKNFSEVRFNRYTQNKKMAEHCDHISSLFPEKIGVPILSCLGLLNNDYEGGEFVMFENQKIEMNQGDLLIFPSNFLYPHRVEPVIKGTRYSYISWVW